MSKVERSRRAWRRLRPPLVVALLPLAVLGVLGLGVQAYGRIRFDPAYFTPETVQRYGTPHDLARALEAGLQAGDQAALAELQGLRWPRRVVASPSTRFVMLWGRTDRYSTYLYFDWQAYDKYLFSFEQAHGRWVLAPPDLYYRMQSGQWRAGFVAGCIAWWAIGALGCGVRRSSRLQVWLCGERRA